MILTINSELCSGCEVCVSVCPFEAITIENGVAQEGNGCTGCGICVENCPAQAIKIDGSEGRQTDSLVLREVWVFIEQHQQKIAKVSLEILSEGRRLADILGAKLAAILPGFGVDRLANTLFNYGAEKLYLLENKGLEVYTTEAYTEVLSELILKERPEILLIGATTTGRDLAPRLAAQLRTGLTADCTTLEIDSAEKLLLMTRPAFGGNLMATIICPNGRPQMATVRPGVMNAILLDVNRSGEIMKIAPEVKNDNLRKVMRKLIPAAQKKSSLEEAEVIIAGGRGIGGAEGFELLNRLAVTLGGEVGGSRIAVEKGWISRESQIGQTGKTVKPKVYIACGISGAIQHVAGIQRSDYIIAINKDGDAPIFKVADLGIVADYRDVLTQLLSVEW